MSVTINGSGTITGATTLATTVASPTFTTPNIDSAQFATVSGTAPLYGCRAWVNFNGTGTVAIRASGNVSSITDNAVGNYTVNFTTAMVDVNYSVASMAQEVAGPSLVAMYISRTSPYATGSIRLSAINTSNSSDADSAFVNVAIFR